MIALRLGQCPGQVFDAVGQGQHQPPGVGAQGAPPFRQRLSRTSKDKDIRRSERFFKGQQQAAKAGDQRHQPAEGQETPVGDAEAANPAQKAY